MQMQPSLPNAMPTAKDPEKFSASMEINGQSGQKLPASKGEIFAANISKLRLHILYEMCSNIVGMIFAFIFEQQSAGHFLNFQSGKEVKK